MVNRVEAATQTWRRKLQTRQLQIKEGRSNSKSSWGIPKDGVADLEKREALVEKAETLLLLLKQKFPGLPQTILDMNKIQYNKVLDVCVWVGACAGMCRGVRVYVF